MLGAVDVRPPAFPAGDRRHHQARRTGGQGAAGASKPPDDAKLENEDPGRCEKDLRAAYQIPQAGAARGGRCREGKGARALFAEPAPRIRHTTSCASPRYSRISRSQIVRWQYPRHRQTHRRPRHQDGSPDRGGSRRVAAHPWLGAVHARRDPGAGSSPRSAPARTSSTSTRLKAPTRKPSCCTITSRPSRRRNRPYRFGPAAAKSATASLPGGRSIRCCRRRTNSPTRSASFPRSRNRTALPRWPRYAAPRWRLMDAGVPLKRPVAGIAMGLIKEGERYAVLSDILGDEDHLGDMDFKVAGTAQGVTSLQMDIKIAGITEEIMKIALAQAKDGRMHILGEMAQGAHCRARRTRRACAAHRGDHRFRPTRSAKSSAPAARSSARSSRRPAPRSTSRMTAR